jgi:hypothetical protein
MGGAFFGGFDQQRNGGFGMGGYSQGYSAQFAQQGYGPRPIQMQQSQFQQGFNPYQQQFQGIPTQQQGAQQVQGQSRPLPASQVLPISRQFTVGPGETLIANKLFVGGLSYDLSEQELVQAFARYGAQKANIICDRETGRSRGYGFVTFDNELSASEAMNFMQGADVNGRRIRIGPATARAQTRAYQQHVQQQQQQQFQQQAVMMSMGSPMSPYGKGPTGASYAMPAKAQMQAYPQISNSKDWSSADPAFGLGGGGIADFGLAPLALDGAGGTW